MSSLVYGSGKKTTAFLVLLLIVSSLSLWDIKVTKKVEIKESLILLDPGAYPYFTDNAELSGIKGGIHESLDYLTIIPENREFLFGKYIFSAKHMKQSLLRFQAIIENKKSDAELNKAIIDEFYVFRSRGRDSDGKVLFTGYYEPLMLGSRNKTETNIYPLYGIPDDLVIADLSLFSDEYKGVKLTGRVEDNKFIPYFDRNDIDFKNRLEGLSQPVAWVADPIDVFFLHIQGSGKIKLDDGSTINVHYHASNGRPYRSIGKYLIDSGKVTREEMSMQKIREYLDNNPEEMEAVLSYNPSYVFFKEEEKGPLGCIGKALTPGRSLAVDRKIFPLSGLVYIETDMPEFDDSGSMTGLEKESRFMLAQDTGGAIKGPGRADIYFGSGDGAGLYAGNMKYEGAMYFLVLKQDSQKMKK